MFKRLSATIVALGFIALPNAHAAVEVECTPSPPVKGYELGLTFQTLLPNELPDFLNTVPLYGPFVGMSIGDHSLLLRGVYGSIEALSTYAFELGMRWNFNLHFFHMYALTGAQLLHYSYSGNRREYWGANLGAGLVFPISGKYQVTMGSKVYLTTRPIMNFEIGFSLFL